MCYYKLDFFDVSQELLSVYLQYYPDSVVALNLKACNNFKLYNGKTAQDDLKQLTENFSSHFKFANDLIKQNLVLLYF